MPYDRRPCHHEEDPEEVAEREFTLVNGSEPVKPTKNGTVEVECAVDVVGARLAASSLLEGSAESKPVPISPVSTDSGNGSSCSLKQHGSFKEDKASRKKRSRGVSGSSIKKDGGRFDMGWDEEYDEDEDDFDPFVRVPMPFEEKVLHLKEKAEPLYFELCFVLGKNSSDYANLLALLSEECTNDSERLTLLFTAMRRIVREDRESRFSNNLVLGSDACAEYRLCVLLAGLFNELFSDVTSLDSAYRAEPKTTNSRFVHMLFMEARQFFVYHTEEVRGETRECPNQAIDHVVALLADKAFLKTGDVEKLRTRFEYMEMFHVEIIKRVYSVYVKRVRAGKTSNKTAIFLNIYEAAFPGYAKCVEHLALVRLYKNGEVEFAGVTKWKHELREIYFEDIKDSSREDKTTLKEKQYCEELRIINQH